jgi:hypothetical protein
LEDKEDAKFIVCVNREGIGNRLRGSISAIRLSKLLNRKLVLYWENNQYLGCDFNDLFENKFTEIDKYVLEEDIKSNSCKVYRDVLDKDFDKYRYIILDTWKWVFLPGEIEKGFNKTYASKEGANIDFEFDRIPLNLRKEILKELNDLIPTQEVLDKVKFFEEQHSLGEYDGMHIRRGDNQFTVDGREKISSDEKFIKIIEDNPENKFFISTDSVDVAKKIKEKFGNSDRIIYYPIEDKKRSNKESIQEALAAIILLSKTNHLYGSFLSTFTEMVWWFNGCNIKVDIVGIEEVKKDFFPKTLWQKIGRKLKYYKVNFLREAYRIYK